MTLRKRSTVRTLIAAVTLTAGSLAQEPAPPVLTLSEAEAMAVKNHPQILASEARYLRADQVIREQESAYYPAIHADVTGSQAIPGSRIGAGFLTDSRLFSRFG